MSVFESVFEALSHSYKTGDKVRSVNWNDHECIYWDKDYEIWRDETNESLSMQILSNIASLTQSSKEWETLAPAKVVRFKLSYDSQWPNVLVEQLTPAHDTGSGYYGETYINVSFCKGVVVAVNIEECE